MRWLGTVVAIASVGAVSAGIGKWHKDRVETAQRVEKTASTVTRVQREISIRMGTGETSKNERGFPVSIDPKWFEGEEPVNSLVDDTHPWLEVAPPQDADLEHPPIRVAIDRATAGLWYNPYRGVVRARVPIAVSDEESLRTYNKVNGTAIPSLFWREPSAESMQVQVATATAKDQMPVVTEPPANPMKQRGLTRAGGGKRKNKKKDSVVVVHHAPAPSTPTEPPPQTASAPE